MLIEKMAKALNGQLNAELYAAYLYLSMAAYFTTKNLNGFANWLRVQAQEELMHAMKIYDYINERDGEVVLTQVGAPKTKWNSPLEAFEDAYNHECKVTGMINELVNLAISEKDHAANSFLQWFVIEQVEEESSALAIVDKLKLVGDDGAALFMIDGELGQRTPPLAE